MKCPGKSGAFHEGLYFSISYPMRTYQYKIWLCGFFIALALPISLTKLYGQKQKPQDHEQRQEIRPSKIQDLDRDDRNINIKESRKLLALPPQKAITAIKKMSVSEAVVRISQIRHLVRKDNPDIDRIYLILRHLEELRAADLAQKRLNNLLWVIALCFLLFSSFLFYIYIDQKRSLRDIESISKKPKRKGTAPVPPVYHGEDGEDGED